VRVAPARLAAYTVLRRVFEGGAYADEALRAESRSLDTRDRALAMRLAYGAVQRRATLDYVLAALSDRAVERLDAHLLAALRLGLYELLYLTGAPDRAVVADAVELAKGHGRGGHGLVNAVLRRATHEAAALVDGLSDETPEGAALMHSHPRWVADMWWEQLGPTAARALMAADNEPGELALRANTLVTDAAELARELPLRTHGDPLLPEALVAEEPFDVYGSQLWRRGAFTAQSRAAMHVARLLAPRPGERVLDLCAAPGGKSTHLAALMAAQGELVAIEHDRRRAGMLARTAERLHARNVKVLIADAAHLPVDVGEFDRVLVDPPCTGLGTLQAHPDLRWRVQEGDPERLAAIQAAILAAGASALRPGGMLLYSTCTVSPIENERLIASFLDSHPGFAIEDLAGELPQLGAAAATGLGARCLLTLPHRDRTAGFFLARLRRT
jgi:16S rRNA (cytosine967-C5)-methyltransferase